MARRIFASLTAAASTVAASAIVAGTALLPPLAASAAGRPHTPPHAAARHSDKQPTGDNKIEQLNEQQLDVNYRGPWHWMNGQPTPSGAPYAPLPPGYPPLPTAGYGPAPAPTGNAPGR